MKNTKERIQRNRNIAVMRLNDKKDRSVRAMVEEMFWPPEIWPDHIVNCMMNFKYRDRICVCNFLFGNGMQLRHAFTLVKFHHPWRISEENYYNYIFTNLWIRIESAVQRIHPNWNEIISTYYFFSMYARCVMFFDGNVRLYGTKINILNNMNTNNNQIRIPHNTSAEQKTQTYSYCNRDNHDNAQRQRDRRMRLERRWRFLASIDRDPIVIDGLTFKFDAKLYTNIID